MLEPYAAATSELELEPEPELVECVVPANTQHGIIISDSQRECITCSYPWMCLPKNPKRWSLGLSWHA